MKTILYLEGASGISGDMTVAALLDLGGSREKLDAVLAGLHLEGFHYGVSRKSSCGIAGCDFDVVLHDHHDHDHEHDHEHGRDHHEHDHGHPHEHSHDHGHEHHEHVHSHKHRNLADVYAVIDRGRMSDRARELAKRIFRIVAEAESEAHGCPVEEVHFHEVGAIDSIVDIVAAAVLADDLGIGECVVTGLTEGSGFVRCQHGELPVPVPAVLNIARKYGIALRPSACRGELVTPTGIAIAAALRTRTTLPELYTVEKVGIGLGKRDIGRANLLRAMLLREEAPPETIQVIECNIDDSTGETLGNAMEQLLKAGARDVHFLPCFMKKNRPAWLLRVIADAEKVPCFEEILFRDTTTIGLRKYPVERTVMTRGAVEVKLPFGTVRAKRCSFGGTVRSYPEYESVKQLAESAGLPFLEVWRATEKALGEAEPSGV